MQPQSYALLDENSYVDAAETQQLVSKQACPWKELYICKKNPDIVQAFKTTCYRIIILFQLIMV